MAVEFYKTEDIAPLAVTGNGKSFRIALMREATRDIKGRMMIPMLVYPSKRIVEIYELKDKLKYLEGTAMWVSFPKKKVIPTGDIDPTQVNYIITCGFEEEPTDLERIYEGLLEEHERRDIEEQSLRKSIARKQEEIEHLRSEQMQYAKFAQKMRETYGRAPAPPEEAEEEPEE